MEGNDAMGFVCACNGVRPLYLEPNMVLERHFLWEVSNISCSKLAGYGERGRMRINLNRGMNLLRNVDKVKMSNIPKRYS